MPRDCNVCIVLLLAIFVANEDLLGLGGSWTVRDIAGSRYGDTRRTSSRSRDRSIIGIMRYRIIPSLKEGGAQDFAIHSVRDFGLVLGEQGIVRALVGF